MFYRSPTQLVAVSFTPGLLASIYTRLIRTRYYRVFITRSMVTGAKASSRQTLLCPGFRDRLNEHSVFFGLFKLARSTVCPPAHDDWHCHYKTALVGTNVPTRPRTPAPSLYQLWLFLAWRQRCLSTAMLATLVLGTIPLSVSVLRYLTTRSIFHIGG